MVVDDQERSERRLDELLRHGGDATPFKRDVNVLWSLLKSLYDTGTRAEQRQLAY
jgi:hypothetical protein